MREQIAQQPARRRASLPPEEREYTTPYHHVGTRSGMHPEDTPYITTTRTYHAPTTATYFEIDEEGEDVYTSPPTRTSARRYTNAPATQKAHVTHHYHDEPFIQRASRQHLLPPQHTSSSSMDGEETKHTSHIHFHPLVWLGVGMIVMIALWIVASTVIDWWQIHQDDSTYGRPRTFQIDQVVGHNDSTENPSHFIVENLNRHFIVIELPGGDPTKARIYPITTLFGDGQDLTPVTLSFKDVNGNGLLDLEIHIQDQTIVMINENGTFRPLKAGERVHI